MDQREESRQAGPLAWKFQWSETDFASLFSTISIIITIRSSKRKEEDRAHFKSEKKRSALNWAASVAYPCFYIPKFLLPPLFGRLSQVDAKISIPHFSIFYLIYSIIIFCGFFHFILFYKIRDTCSYLRMNCLTQFSCSALALNFTPTIM